MTSALPSRESLTVEFKSDRTQLPDRQSVEAIVCMANSEGGELWLGVEDDGTPTGLHANHADLAGLEGLVASRTAPPLAVKVERVALPQAVVARIEVPRSGSDVSTTGGVYLRRRLNAGGLPECVPMLPHDRASRGSTFGRHDVSAQPVAGAQLSDLDPLERERLRQNIEQYGGDRVLLELDDMGLDGALGLTSRGADGTRVPTLTGLLLIGRETALRELVAPHELAFQVLEREAVGFNEFRRFPLLKLLDWLETSFRPYNPEREIQVGLFPGLLVTEPRPRNRALADAMKRVGLVERSGRGVDAIYRGMLRFGRPEPDYRRTDSNSVVLRLSTAHADEAFLRLVVEEEGRRKTPLPIDTLIALAALGAAKRLSAEELAQQIQRDVPQAKRTLEALVETGLVQVHGNSPRTRSYMLAPQLYGTQRADRVAYTRQAGLSNLQHEQLVLNFARQHGRVRRADVVELCRLKEGQAKALLVRMRDAGQLVPHGNRGGTFYVLPTVQQDAS